MCCAKILVLGVIKMQLEQADQMYREEMLSLERVSILVAEDDESIREILGLFLRSCGANVEFAENGLQSVQKVLEKKFDIVLMDLSLPIMSGEKAVDLLRLAKVSIPIIGVTAYDDEARKKECLSKGFSDFLTKPFELDDLVSKILFFTQKNTNVNLSIH